MSRRTASANSRVEPELLSVSELFVSIQGEGLAAGRPCTFIRLAGCNLRCSYCDTAYAWEESDGTRMPVNDVILYVRQSGMRLVEITGGEPLLQAAVYPLLDALLANDFEVLLETAGHVDAGRVPAEVVRIIDLKTPGSGMAQGAHLVNLSSLRVTDEIKFVLVDRPDYEWAKEILQKYPILTTVASVLFSPAFSSLSPRDLADWIIADRLPVRFQLQLHKYVWEPDKRGV
jgi:7-carboxy-7-deazaguanine synthase